MPDDPIPDPYPDLHLLRCLACGKTVECTRADMLRYTRAGWPRCCGKVMALFSQADKPTPPERPGID